MRVLYAMAALFVMTVTAAADDKRPGLPVGDKAPAFTLKDQDGKERSLQDLLKKGKVALVFYRSADW